MIATPEMLDVGATFFAGLRPPKHRTYLQFAEEELILASGPRKGSRFRSDFMPWTRLLLQEYDRGRYRRFFLSGPAQSGKTLLAFQLPLLYHLFEMGESVIVGVPKVDMAQGIYEEKILPTLKLTRYAKYLPLTGTGSRGGKFVAINFTNGATLRFMGSGGGDEQRSSHTARVVVLTEIDKMDTPGKASREADPVSQIEARTASFGDRALVFAECTMSTELGRIYREVVEFGTDTKPVFPCPHCGRYVPLERAGLQGWQGTPDILVARERATFVCNVCTKAWTEADRASALERPLLLSKDQKIDEQGQVVGETPKTLTFGFRWTALSSGLQSMATIAEKEWRAERTGSSTDEKALLQFTWAEPYTEDLVNLSELTREIILGKIVGHPRGTVPTGALKTVLAIDIGLYRCWWTLLGWNADASGHVIDYGSIEVPQEQRTKPEPLLILSALRAFREEVIRPGWEGARQPDLVLIDSGWEKDIVYQFVAESGQPRFLAVKGQGTGRNQEAWRPPRNPDKAKQIGNEWVAVLQPNGIRLLEIHADYWKGAVHEGFAAANGAPGSLTLYQAQPREHISFARSIMAERREEEFVAGKGERVFWNRIEKHNHFLDCCAYARCGADILGIKLTRPQLPPRPSRSGSQDVKGSIGLRTKY